MAQNKHLTGNIFSSSSCEEEISKKEGKDNSMLINLEYKIKTPLVVCLNNNYDTEFSFFFYSKM